MNSKVQLQNLQSAQKSRSQIQEFQQELEIVDTIVPRSPVYSNGLNVTVDNIVMKLTLTVPSIKTFIKRALRKPGRDAIAVPKPKIVAE